MRIFTPRHTTLACLGLAALAFVGCTKLAPPTPLSQLDPQQLRGYQAFHAACAQCHNDRTNDPLNGPALRSIFKKQYLDSGAPATDDNVMSAITFGRLNMPALGAYLTPQQRADILAYLHTL